jgi:hypothetical protein
MYFLNTTRHLDVSASDAVLERLLAKLSGAMTDSLGAGGVRANAWLVSADRRTFQSFSGFDQAADVDRAQDSSGHLENSAVINDLLGGLAMPQQHTSYRLLLSRQMP